MRAGVARRQRGQKRLVASNSSKLSGGRAIVRILHRAYNAGTMFRPRLALKITLLIVAVMIVGFGVSTIVTI